MKKIHNVDKIIKIIKDVKPRKVNVDKILTDIKKNKRLQKLNKDFEKEIEIHLISANFKPKKKTNYYKLVDGVLQVAAYLSLASIITLYAVLWII